MYSRASFIYTEMIPRVCTNTNDVIYNKQILHATVLDIKLYYYYYHTLGMQYSTRPQAKLNITILLPAVQILIV